MSGLLYYPNYTPSEIQLRSILLLFDQIKLIVPYVDRNGVKNRSHVRSLLEIDPRVVGFYDPEDGYGKWAENGDALEYLQRIINFAENGSADKLQSAKITSYGRLIEPDGGLVESLFEAGWKPIAAQKFPAPVREMIVRARVGVEIGYYRNPKTNKIIEHNCILAIPEVANFVLSRLSGEISFRNRIPTMTFSGVGHTGHIFEKFI
jgi:hypothetical protein